MKWRIITPTGFVELAKEPTQEEYDRVRGIGEVQVIDDTPVWDKAAYCDDVNSAHNDLFQQLYTERDYLTIGEIPIWQNDEDFGAESLALQLWWVNTCKIVSAYLETVTEETAQPIETFINSLPKFNH